MSKSVLVIDTPENCRSCYLQGFMLNLQYCRGKLKDIKDTSVKPDWCPLKPCPECFTGCPGDQGETIRKLQSNE